MSETKTDDAKLAGTIATCTETLATMKQAGRELSAEWEWIDTLLSRLAAAQEQNQRLTARLAEIEGDKHAEGDGTSRLLKCLYGEDSPNTIRKALGGSEAKMLHDATDEIDRLRERIEGLEGVIRRCCVDASGATTGDEATDNQRLGAAMAVELNKADMFVSDQFAELECQVAQSQAQQAAQAAELERVRGERDDTQRELRAAKYNGDSLLRQLWDSKDNAKHLEQELAELRTALAAEREKVAALTRERDDYRKGAEVEAHAGDEARHALAATWEKSTRQHRQIANAAKLIDYLWKRRDALKELWFIADQTIGCQLCGWIDWEDESGEIPPHSDECHLGYLMNRHVPKFELDEAKQALAASQSRAERAEGELRKLRGEPMTEAELQQIGERAQKQVDALPPAYRNILEDGLSPTVRVPRKPIPYTPTPAAQEGE